MRSEVIPRDQRVLLLRIALVEVALGYISIDDVRLPIKGGTGQRTSYLPRRGMIRLWWVLLPSAPFSLTLYLS